MTKNDKAELREIHQLINGLKLNLTLPELNTAHCLDICEHVGRRLEALYIKHENRIKTLL